MGYTQAEISALVGVSQVVYSNYELGKRQPKPMTLKRIADVCNCKVDDLFEHDIENVGRSS